MEYLLHVFVLKEIYCIKLSSASDIKVSQPSLFKNRKLKQVKCLHFSLKYACIYKLIQPDFEISGRLPSKAELLEGADADLTV